MFVIITWNPCLVNQRNHFRFSLRATTFPVVSHISRSMKDENGLTFHQDVNRNYNTHPKRTSISCWKFDYDEEMCDLQPRRHHQLVKNKILKALNTPQVFIWFRNCLADAAWTNNCQRAEPNRAELCDRPRAALLNVRLLIFYWFYIISIHLILMLSQFLLLQCSCVVAMLEGYALEIVYVEACCRQIEGMTLTLCNSSSSIIRKWTHIDCHEEKIPLVYLLILHLPATTTVTIDEEKHRKELRWRLHVDTIS